MEEKKTPRATSYTQLEIELQQPPLKKGMSIQKQVAKHMNEGKNMVEMSFEGKHESLSNILEVNIEEENLNYNANIILRSNEELEKPQTMENEANELEDLVVMEDDPTSPKSHEMIKDEVVGTIPKMAPWGDMHEELKIEEVTPMSKAKEYIV